MSGTTPINVPTPIAWRAVLQGGAVTADRTDITADQTDITADQTKE